MLLHLLTKAFGTSQPMTSLSEWREGMDGFVTTTTNSGICSVSPNIAKKIDTNAEVFGPFDPVVLKLLTKYFKSRSLLKYIRIKA